MTAGAPANGANKLGLWLGIIISAVAILGVIGSIFSMAFKVQSNAESLGIQGQLLKTESDQIATLQDRLTKIEVSMNEIETQFCAHDIVRNLMHANDMRNVALLWEKTYGLKYPTDNSFYPTICNRRK